MRLALEAARTALHIGEVPIGAVLAKDGAVVSRGFNQPIHNLDPTAHAEIVALQIGGKRIGNYRMLGSTLYVTTEPCLMCVGALVSARISRLVYGAPEPKSGAVSSILDIEKLPLNHRFDVVSGVLEDECRQLLVDFFAWRREEA